MHRLIENHLEEALSKGGLPQDHPARQHLNECGDCRSEVDAMREQAAVLQDWAVPQEMDPHPGFYARVWDRIEAQRPVSIWNLFTESVWGRRLVTASLSVALLMGGYVISAERSAHGLSASGDPMAERLLAGNDNSMLMAAVKPSPNAVFVDLVSYQGR